MSSTGLCAICNAPETEAFCDRCGRLVCDDHFDDSAGYCTECAAELGPERGGGTNDDDLPDGVDTYEF
jgi:hypothetical protein